MALIVVVARVIIQLPHSLLLQANIHLIAIGSINVCTGIDLFVFYVFSSIFHNISV